MSFFIVRIESPAWPIDPREESTTLQRWSTSLISCDAPAAEKVFLMRMLPQIKFWIGIRTWRVIRRRGATPNARERKEMFVDSVRIAGARSAEGGKEEEEPVERVVHVETREYGFRAESVFEVMVEVTMDSDWSLRRQ